MASQVLWACPTARQRSCGITASGLPLPDCQQNLLPATAELSRFPYMVLTHMLQVSGSGELKPALALSHRLHVAFPTVVQGRRSRGVISEINTAPVRPSANASPRHRWSSMHSLRPKRVASPYSAKDFHLLHHAGFYRRFHYVPQITAERQTLLNMLEKHGGNRKKTAAELGISPVTLWRKLKTPGV